MSHEFQLTGSSAFQAKDDGRGGVDFHVRAQNFTIPNQKQSQSAHDPMVAFHCENRDRFSYF